MKPTMDDMHILRAALEKGHRFVIIVEPINGKSSARMTNTEPAVEARMLGRAYRSALEQARNE